ncbi:hypothetical protein A3A60_04870 [Candidatus Curtissbacteria bacterium RIFCSPLOWO2_01_FULL_42_26]|uniref:Bacterial spore germination immunoglobulin-like domain-containing protein n=1 Tax=Candidatus Curtissbacteria bacterium RIFCSPLOWO2_01_FULL_42_26 TaxID=1797729 RepID=A0A1F5I0J5_9BACT|nr:MAG: hypothetical protein A3A60_04870 [Candidatus Curtissbacteria bacterium RIFCSPLOWO2_01_FULL_42_26]
MNNYRVAILAAIVLIILFAGAYFIYKNQVTNQISTINESPSPESLTLPSPSPTILPAGGEAQVNEQPQSGSDTVEVKNIGIQVASPSGSSAISSPVTVSGSANVFEGRIVIRVKDGGGQLLGSGEATACMGYDACAFTTTINFNSSLTQAGTIEVYNPSGVNGTPHYLQQILVRFN